MLKTIVLGRFIANAFVADCRAERRFLSQLPYNRDGAKAAERVIQHLWGEMRRAGAEEDLPPKPAAYAKIQSLSRNEAIEVGLDAVDAAIKWGKRHPEYKKEVGGKHVGMSFVPDEQPQKPASGSAKKRRPCFDRDQVFLNYKNEGLGDAAIRDRWNAENPHETVGDGTPGREVVKKGIAAAKADLK